jgi:hypothetical protein
MQVSNMRPLKKRDVAASKACDSTPTIFSFLSSRYETRGDAKISKAWIADDLTMHGKKLPNNSTLAWPCHRVVHTLGQMHLKPRLESPFWQCMPNMRGITSQVQQ